jgi:hypothetical protein
VIGCINIVLAEAKVTKVRDDQNQKSKIQCSVLLDLLIPFLEDYFGMISLSLYSMGDYLPQSC